jgi:ubiquinone/menaquinone biosynthesis C-methylase UbiE
MTTEEKGHVLMSHTHKFNPDNAGHLDHPLRKWLLAQGEVLTAANPKQEDLWADIGCGTGFFSIPLSKRVKKVYAIDISQQMLDILKGKISHSRIINIDPLLSQENVLPLPENSVDGIFMAFVAHELSEPAVFFAELKRILRNGGRLFIVEFTKRGYFGPPTSERLEKERIDRWAINTGLEAGTAYHWSKSLLGWKYVDIAGWEYLKK